MKIISKSKLRELKACRRACKKIYAAMAAANEDENGNVSPYRWDKIHEDILKALADAGYGTTRVKIVGIDEWIYDIPWKLDGIKV